MRYLVSAVVFFLVSPILAIGQNNADSSSFSEKNYVLISKGVDPDNSFQHYVMIYKNSSDSNYMLKKVFLDSTYTDLMSKSFFKNNLQDGPFFFYANGKVILEGNYKNGFWHGEKIKYDDGKILQRDFFFEGKKTGTSEEYDRNGKIIRKTTYDSGGVVIADIRY